MRLRARDTHRLHVDRRLPCEPPNGVGDIDFERARKPPDPLPQPRQRGDALEVARVDAKQPRWTIPGRPDARNQARRRNRLRISGEKNVAARIGR